MEYYWGYAAANTNLYHPRRPTRSNSTNAAPATRRSRIPGHRRTTSSDSARSRSSHEIPLQLDLKPHQPAAPAPAPVVPAAEGDALRDRMPASVRYQNKQLPAIPRLDTHEAAARYGSTTGAVSPGLAGLPGLSPLPASPTAEVSLKTPTAAKHHATMLPESAAFHSKIPGASPFGRNDSVSSISATTLSTRTMMSSDPPTSAEGGTYLATSPPQQRPFVVRSGRSYLSDPFLPYPLPVDLAELHRQTLRTLLLFQLFTGPVCSPAFAGKPPARVLEVGCGSGFWSMMCHQYYSQRGHSGISFTGLDVAPISSGASSGNLTPLFGSSSRRPDRDMRWQFVQHDMRRIPWPFAPDEFDLVMVKDISLATPTALQQSLMEEYIRILRPGGTLEIWESDHTIRMLRPHVPEPSSSGLADDEEEHESAERLGAYLMTANTPLSAPSNSYIVEYNAWLAKALEARSLSPVPCTLIGPMLLQESDILTGIGSRRLAVPLSEVRWEREGVGGVITKDGKTYSETRAKSRETEQSRRTQTAGQLALRKTALQTVVQQIQSLEPLLKEVSKKSQDEWDGWSGKMMNDLMIENGTSLGECLEVGAWWARKKK